MRVAPQPALDAGRQRFSADEDEQPARLERLFPVGSGDHDALEPVAAFGARDVSACPGL